MSSLKKLYGLQYLRAIAAIVVVVHHAQSAIPQFSDANSLWLSFYHISIWGRIGVDIFFVISGFIMYSIILNTEYSIANVCHFFKKRFLRVAPLYWFYTLITLILVFDRAQLFSENNVVYMKQFVLSVLFIPYFDSKGVFQHPLLMVGWTLILEMYFYSLVALCFLLFRRYAFVVTIAIIVASVYYFIPMQEALKWVVSNVYLLEFALGIVIGLIYYSQYYLKKVWAISVLAFGCAVALFTVFYDTSMTLFYLRAISAFCIVLSVIYLEESLPKIKFLSFIGDASYTLYLSHTILFFILTILFNKFFIVFESATVLIGFMTLLSIAVGALLYKIIELPLTHVLKKL